MNSFKGLFLESPIRAPPFLLGELTDGKEQIRFKDSSLWILTIRGICFRFGKKLLQSFALVKFVATSTLCFRLLTKRYMEPWVRL
ncbi:hypothetical protein OIU79_029316 [Salix purpurea]|uniref:Uncharacterized protein n=1 Tax=Salix purpurea TaxID=77065 RepID=A0A9Q0VGC6_SALPP|nr:hypothetical protein OIU79_029316 [Salix purpurea]